ncbi:MAG: DoxX family protein [Pirellulales bacterium]
MLGKLLPKSPSLMPSFGLLALRLVFGIGMATHGWGKVQNMTGWMDAYGPSGVPSFLQAAAAISEFGGGICLAVGFLTPVAAFLIMATMSVAAYKHISGGDPFSLSWNPADSRGHWELAALYWGTAFSLMLTGPGMHSIDQVVFKGKCEEA